ncbi:MAG: OmpA family protein [Balneolales bacterium]|nr:OmpA family protein [Balneolales bacterium]
MKNIKLYAFPLILIIIVAGCSSLSNTERGAMIGAAGGGAIGYIIGHASGNATLGTVVGATVGGATGAVIGNQMDKQAEEIKNDIPDANVVRVGEGIYIEFSNNVLFGFDSANLSDDARANLRKLSDILKKYPDTDIEIQGHTDSTGSATYNQGLSERRANAVSGYITQSGGIASNRVTTLGFGEEAPKYTNDTEEGRAQNRRVEFLITANEKMVAEAEREAESN